jgi:hypothetical protein
MTSSNREGVDCQIKKLRAELKKDGGFHCKPHKVKVKVEYTLVEALR